MRKFLLTTATIALAVFAADPAAAQQMDPADAETVEVTATVVGVSCNLLKGATGEGHRACAQACAKAGKPLGLLTEDGTFYMPVTGSAGKADANQPLIEFAEQQVRVTGRVIERAGLNAIVIESVERA